MVSWCFPTFEICIRKYVFDETCTIPVLLLRKLLVRSCVVLTVTNVCFSGCIVFSFDTGISVNDRSEPLLNF